MTTPSLTIRILGRLGLLLFGTIVSIGFLEVVARIAWNDAWLDPRRDSPAEEGLEEIKSLMRMASRNIRGINRHVFYRTNEHGVRSRNHSQRPADGVFRILMTGDSVAMGSGVLEEHRFSDLIDGSRQGEHDREYEFVNIALSGLNSSHVMNRLERLLPHYESDLFLYAFTINAILGKNYISQQAEEDSSSLTEEPGSGWALKSDAEVLPSYLLRYVIARQWAYVYAHGLGYDDFHPQLLRE
jgi:hypothetical protein